MTTAAAKKKADAEAEKPAAKKAEEAPEPVVETRVSFDGLRAVDTIDGEAQDAREATFAEQVAQLAPLIRDQAVGIVHNAGSASVEVDGNVVTITLVPR